MSTLFPLNSGRNVCHLCQLILTEGLKLQIRLCASEVHSSLTVRV